MKIRALLDRHPLIGFIALNYAISWAFLYPALQLLKRSPGTFPPLALLGLIGQFGPSIAAVLVLAATQGTPALRSAFRMFFQWRVHAGWYLFVLLVPLAVYIAAVLVQARLRLNVASGLGAIPLSFLIALPFGPLGEELGWRGFLLPRLLRRYGPVKATIFLGCVWSTWHLASFTYPGAAIPSFQAVSAYSILLFFCNITAVSFLFTYVFLRTGGSLLLMVLLHMAFDANTNVAAAFFPSLEKAGAALNNDIYTASILLMAAIGAGCLALDSRARARARTRGNDRETLHRLKGRS